MSYSVTIGARAEIRTVGNQNKSYLKLPDTNFGSTSKPIYPYQLTSRIAAGQSEVVDLSNFGFTKVKALIVKSTRPVTVTLTNVDGSLVFPLSTYLLHLLNTPELVFTDIDTITIAVPVAPVTNPVPAPTFFPAALVEVFVVSEEA